MRKVLKTKRLEAQGKHIILGLIVLLGVVFGVSLINAFSSNYLNNNFNDLCYQETANNSTLCGGLKTGTYSFDGNGFSSYQNTFDGNYSTAGYIGGGGSAYLDINYSKPAGSQNSSKWRVKIGGDYGDINESIPIDCWNAYTNKLVLRLESHYFGGQYAQGLSWCFNLTDWKEIRENTPTSAGWDYYNLYDEAMTWNITIVNLSSETLNLAYDTNVTRYLYLPNNTVLTNAFMDILGTNNINISIGNSIIFSSNISSRVSEFNYPAYATYYLSTATRMGGQSFKIGITGTNTTQTIDYIILNMTRISGSGFENLSLYTLNSSGYPDVLIASNTSIDVSGISGTGYFPFKIKLPITILNKGVSYAFMFGYSNGDIRYEASNPSTYSGGDVLDFNAGTWSKITISDLYFSVGSDSTFLNTTQNFANVINSYANNCSLINGYCYIPFTFSSNLSATMTYQNISFNDIGFLQNSITYNNLTYESSLENFILNITYDDNFYTGYSASFIYNNTAYPVTTLAYGNDRVLISNLSVPFISSSGTNKTFYWNITLTNSSGSFSFLSSYNNQTINKPTSLNTNILCSAGYSPAFNFTFYYEDNLSLVNISKVDYLFTYGLLGNPNSYTLNGSLTNINQFSLCINNSEPYFTIGYGELKYYTADSVRRSYYIFQNTRITNQSTAISLYNLQSTSATQFTITAQTTSLNPYVNYYVGLLRWYPNLNQYKVVEIGKTDIYGNTVLNIRALDTNYRIGLYAPDGTLITLLQSTEFVCQSNPCVYNILVNSNPVDLTTFTGIQNSLTYDSILKRFTFVWNDPTQTSQVMNLTLYQQSGTDNTIICSSSASGYTGVIVCDVGGYTGRIKAEVTRTASPLMIIAQDIEDIRSTFIDAGGGTIGLLIGAILLIFFALVGTISPVLVIILSVVAIIPLFILGNITWLVLTGFGILGGVILHFLRRIS